MMDAFRKLLLDMGSDVRSGGTGMLRGEGGGGKLGKVSYLRDTAKSCNNASSHDSSLTAHCRR